MVIRCAPVIAILGALTLTLSCSLAGSSDDNAGTGSTPGIIVDVGSGGRLASGASGSGGRGSGAVGSVTQPNDCALKEDAAGCVGEAFEGETIPLDIYVMFDQSGSMCSCIDPPGIVCPDPNCRERRIDAVRTALDEFMQDPKSAGIGIGIGYFGKQPIGLAVCDAEEYSAPSVSIAPLPNQEPVIMASLNSINPTGETPTGAAIRGACSYAREAKQAVPTHQVVMLLLTDGKPEAPVTCQGANAACCPTLDDAVAAAADCLDGDPGIKTYVLGVGPELENLAQIANAGGSDHAYLVDGADVSQQVLAALNKIRGDATIPCEFQLPTPPDGEELLYDHVNIKYADPVCNSTLYLYVESPDRCGPSGGWYYDDPTNPKTIRLCPTSCDQVSTPGGRLFYSVGCETQVPLR